MAAMYAGTILTPGIVSDEGLQTYLKSVAHFEEETKKAKVVVELQNHPLMDPIQTEAGQTQGPEKRRVESVRGRPSKLSEVSGCHVGVHRGEYRPAERLVSASRQKATFRRKLDDSGAGSGRRPALPVVGLITGDLTEKVPLRLYSGRPTARSW